MKQYTFPKAEHLCLKRDIEALFSAGNASMTAFPLRLTYGKAVRPEGEPKVKVMMSVSKRRFKHAVDRNRAKRQLREAYRLQKSILLQHLPEESAYNMAFIWLASKPQESALVHKRLGSLLQRMAERIAKEEEHSTKEAERIAKECESHKA